MAYNVLVVDDSSTSRKIVIKSLRMSGLDIQKIHEARDGVQAMEILKENWIDIVLADLNMPRMGGVELVGKMAEDDLLLDIPVVIITSDRNRERLSRLLRQGVRACLNKPFHPEALRETLEEALAAQERRNP